MATAHTPTRRATGSVSVISDFQKTGHKESDRALSAEAVVLDFAARVIGDKNQAMRWMGTPVRALGYATPISLVGTRSGRDAIFTVLSRLEHGVL